MSTRSPVDTARGRQNDLAAIHIAKKALHLTEEEYRDIMATVCAGVRSSAQMDWTLRKRFREHLEACLRRQNGRSVATRTRRELTPRERKMWALWMQLAEAGLVQQRTMSALAAFAQRQTGVDRLEWLNGAQQDLVIESLKRYLQRGGAD